MTAAIEVKPGTPKCARTVDGHRCDLDGTLFPILQCFAPGWMYPLGRKQDPIEIAIGLRVCLPHSAKLGVDDVLGHPQAWDAIVESLKRSKKVAPVRERTRLKFVGEDDPRIQQLLSRRPQ